MNNLIVRIENVNGQLVVSSRVIAEQLDKQHKHVLESIENIIKNSTADISALFIKSEYIASNGKSNKEYLLTQDGFTLYMFNIQGYNDFKMAYINEFNKMKETLNKHLKIPTTMKEALQIALEQAEKIEALENKITKDKPKIEFYNDVIDSDNTCDMQTVAKLLNFKGVGRNKLFEILRAKHILQNDNKPYQKYVDNGYFRLIEVKYNDYKTGELKISFKTVVFQKGVEKISSILKGLGYRKAS